MSDMVVVITGASSGIGAALGELLAQGGARLALVGRNAEPLAAVAQRSGCVHAGGGSRGGGEVLRGQRGGSD